MTNSERRISRQRSFLPLPAEVRPDWWMLSAVADKLGYGGAFAYERPADIFREHAALSAHENTGQRAFNIAGLAELSDEGYATLEPVQWPVPNNAGPAATDSSRLFSDGRFVTDNGRARFVAIDTVLPVQKTCDDYPMVVNTGRIRDQWHTMTRTASSSRLLTHRSEPFVEVHPDDLAMLKLTEGHLARLTLNAGAYVGRVRKSSEQRRGEVFIPIHWNRQFASDGVATLLTESVTDPVSGQPEAKHGRAAIKPFRASWHGRLLVRRNRPRRWQSDYWCHVPLSHCDSWWLAGRQPVHWPAVMTDWLGGAAHMVMADAAQGRFRAARVVNGQLEAILMVDRDPALIPDAGWLDGCFAEPELAVASRRALLAARDVGVEDPGAIICSCFQIGENQIVGAIHEGAGTVDALGDTLRCGTNCGSCIPELRDLLDASVGESV